MEIKKDKFVISPDQSIYWDDVQTLRLLNDRLIFVLQDKSKIELSNLRASMIDLAFRTYEAYLKERAQKE